MSSVIACQLIPKAIEKNKPNVLLCLKPLFKFFFKKDLSSHPKPLPSQKCRYLHRCLDVAQMQDVSLAICRRFAEKCKNPLCLGGLKPAGFTSNLEAHD